MKLFTSLLLISCALSLINCGNGPHSNSNQGPLPKERVGTYGYKFDSKNSQGEACTTGVRNFENLHLMCIHIQDPGKNNDCALDERFAKFKSDCWPQGYSFYESHSCQISLVDKAAHIKTGGEVDPKLIIKTLRYCVGYNESGATLDQLSEKASLHENIDVEINMRFVPTAKETLDNRTSLKLRVREKFPNGPLISEYNTPHVGYRTKVIHGPILHEKYQYLQKCEMTWACTK